MALFTPPRFLQFLGYCLLVVCAVLLLRVLAVISGAGRGRSGLGMNG